MAPRSTRGPGSGVEGDVQHVLVRRFYRIRAADRGQRMAAIPQGGEQVALRGQHLGRDRRVAGSDAQLGAVRVRHRAVHHDAAQVEQRAALHRHGDRGDAAGGLGGQRVRQAGIVQRTAVDADRGVAAIVAEAVQRRFQPAGIALRAGHQRERPDGGAFAQADQGGAVAQRAIDRAVPGGGDGDLVGLRVRRAGGRAHGQRASREDHEGGEGSAATHPPALYRVGESRTRAPAQATVRHATATALSLWCHGGRVMPAAMGSTVDGRLATRHRLPHFAPPRGAAGVWPDSIPSRWRVLRGVRAVRRGVFAVAWTLVACAVQGVLLLVARPGQGGVRPAVLGRSSPG